MRRAARLSDGMTPLHDLVDGQRFLEQILELVRDYGPIDCIWLDGGQVQRRNGLEINIEDIITAVKDGSLKLGYLQRCAAKLLEIDLKCGGFPEAGPYLADKTLKSFVTQE